MDLEAVMNELEKLGEDQIKQIYRNHGAREPLFGVTTGAMKPLAKKMKKDYELSMTLYATGNYDAAYLAGMIADPKKMGQEDFEKWMKTAYCNMMSDYVVAVVLAETDFAQELSDRWINSGKELYMCAGWRCYCWMLEYLPNESFDKEKLRRMLDWACQHIHAQPNFTRYSMNKFVIAVGISYLPLHGEALKAAEHIGKVNVDVGNTGCETPLAFQTIRKAEEKGRLGFKRKNARC